MSERITVRLDDELYGWLMDAAKARRMDISSVVRQAVSASVAGARTSALPSVPPHTPEDCLAIVLSHASPRTQRRLAETSPGSTGSSRTRDARGSGLSPRPWPIGPSERSNGSTRPPGGPCKGTGVYERLTRRVADGVRARWSDTAKARESTSFQLSDRRA
jgi:hypothetical protein